MLLVFSMPFSRVYEENVPILGLYTCKPPFVAIQRLPEWSLQRALMWSSIRVFMLSRETE